jgi:glutamate--cysteine ligase regulatory subunit
LFYLDSCNEYQPSHIDKAIHHLQQLLDVKSIDTFIVSFDADNSALSVNKAWRDLEVYHEKGVIQKLGLADFDYQTLTDFLNKEDLNVKPSIDQVHVDQCCSLPQDLIKLGKEHGIELTFNGDTTGTIRASNLSIVN